MTKKMTGKQDTSGAFDLDAFVKAGDPVAKPSEAQAAESKVVKRPSAPENAKRPVGRPPVTKEEARDQNVQIKLTKAELANLKEQAGLVPVSIYLRAKLTELGVI
jgi:hypothetical protein